MAVRGEWEERSGAEPDDAQDCRGDAGEGDGNEGARTPLEEQQLDREQHRGEWRREGGGHAGRRSGDEQRGALRIRELDPLRQQRTEGAAGHDDRTFRAERAAGADGDGGGDGFEYGDARLDARAVQQDGFNGFGNAVAANLVRAVAGHDADDDAADDRYQHHPVAERTAGRADHREG